MSPRAVFAFAIAAVAVACTTSTDASDAGATGSVAQCQQMASHFAKLCSGSNPRPCAWDAYVQLCGSGQTQLLIDSMKCLDQTTCRTFSDPNQAAPCLASVHASGESQAAKAYLESVCTACGQTNCTTVTGTAEIIPYLSDSDIAALGNCRGNACTLDAITKACGNTVDDVAPFAACSP